MAQHRRRRHGGGRKRKTGARTPSGRLSRAFKTIARDPGTREAERHRIALVNGSDQALASSVTGVLFARGVLDDRRYRAALAYRMARSAIFGAVLASRDHDRTIPSEERIRMLERRFDRLARRLTVGQKMALTSISLDLWPLWAKRQLLGLELGQADQRERQDLLDGLDVIGA